MKTAVVNCRLTETAKDLLRLLAESRGLSMSAVLEQEIRAAAKRAAIVPTRAVKAAT
jgi:hypothetical protein